MKPVNVGIIGGGLMGREIASAFTRWCALVGTEVQPILKGVCDLNPEALKWFESIGTVEFSTSEVGDLLAAPEIEVLYVAVPHHLHRDIYLRVLESGKDLLAEKPFGIDLESAEEIQAAAAAHGCFVRCSSEMPFFPAAQYGYRYLTAGNHGRLLEATFGFHHSSDLDPGKTANWKRREESCGKIGVMGDLGMHVVHIPFRLGWKPESVYAQLQKGYSERPDGKGGRAACDTFDNAVLHTWVHLPEASFPMRLEMKRLAPGATNTWFFEVLFTDGGIRYSTQFPKTAWVFEREGKDQRWYRRELGFDMAFPAVTGGIFEPGFPDVIQQMWAAFLVEREDSLDGRLGCVTPEEAVISHRLFRAGLISHEKNRTVSLPEGHL